MAVFAKSAMQQQQQDDADDDDELELTRFVRRGFEQPAS